MPFYSVIIYINNLGNSSRIKPYQSVKKLYNSPDRCKESWHIGESKCWPEKTRVLGHLAKASPRRLTIWRL